MSEAMAEQPKKSQKDPTRQRSLDLLAFWYRCRCADGAQRYHPDKSELTITVSTERSNVSPFQRSSKTLTAHGVEAHRPDPEVLGSYPFGHATQPYTDGGNDDSSRRAAYERHARACMMHVINVHAGFHRALEMHAAQWSLEEIAAELNVSVHKARTHIECGLAVISSFRILEKPSWA